MKKSLLLLFISFAFISSVNANSIKGTFGYELGQVVKDTERKEFFVGDDKYVSPTKTFIPKKPLPGNFTYMLSTTLIDKKVHEIQARIWKNESEDNLNSCNSSSGFLKKILNIFEGKYGKFENKSNLNMPDTKFFRYVEGDRKIHIFCRRSAWKFTFEIYYDDLKLSKILRKEQESLLAKENKEKSSEYDI